MNKKIMLISALLCANNMVFSAQENTSIKPLTTAESKIYKQLVDKFYGKVLTADDDTVENRIILGKRASFLDERQKVRIPGNVKLMSSVLLALFPSLLVKSLVGNAESSLLLYLLGGTMIVQAAHNIFSDEPGYTELKKEENELKLINDIIHQLTRTKVLAVW